MSTDTDAMAKTVAATIRIIADQYPGERFSADLLEVARQVEADWDGACCPVCEEVTCDDGCPLEEIRARKDAEDLAAFREQRSKL